MRLRPTDTPRPIDPMLPEVQTAIDRIKSELMQVEHEFPTWTPCQVLREAKRRCAGAMVAAADAIEELDRRRRMAQRNGASQ
jgi:hypothetical protein